MNWGLPGGWAGAGEVEGRTSQEEKTTKEVRGTILPQVVPRVRGKQKDEAIEISWDQSRKSMTTSKRRAFVQGQWFLGRGSGCSSPEDYVLCPLGPQTIRSRQQYLGIARGYSPSFNRLLSSFPTSFPSQIHILLLRGRK